MVYNLGFAGFCKFNDVTAAMERRDYAAASRAMLDSRWAEQVGNRAVELAELIKNGG
jgi:lysozyme